MYIKLHNCQHVVCCNCNYAKIYRSLSFTCLKTLNANCAHQCHLWQDKEAAKPGIFVTNAQEDYVYIFNEYTFYIFIKGVS